MADECQEKGGLQVAAFLFSTSWQKNKAHFIYRNAKVLYLSNYTLFLQHSFEPITKLNTKLSIRPTIKLPAWQEGGEEFKFPLPKSVFSWAYLTQPLSWSSLNSPSSPGLLGGSSRGLSTILLAKGQRRGASRESSSCVIPDNQVPNIQNNQKYKHSEWLKPSQSSHTAPENLWTSSLLQFIASYLVFPPLHSPYNKHRVQLIICILFIHNLHFFSIKI